ncbi:hypothetical protein HPB52_000408 [Rhipicephalus sanguineus]|uniref:Uncharacterized protein n=1 Tax=Rhipicephalus sanguineus TaxID=34632 RepID=A0A9D4T6X9_RHISA|nr:hypothetical protein HPB52_000408 [Rhipicephalus sanguineus]
MRWLAADREDQSDLASDGGARGSSALDGPFNSTMVEGGVPIHQVPSPSTTSTGGPSTRTLVPDTEDEPLTDVPQPMASPPPPPESSPTVVIPPCPPRVYRHMQLRELRRVPYSWRLPPH